MAEVNRKMQRALEEALMKNIHLQQVCDGIFFAFKLIFLFRRMLICYQLSCKKRKKVKRRHLKVA